MTNVVLKDVFVSLNELNRYYEGHVPVDLWRAFNTKKNVSLFDLIEVPIKLSNGKVRKPDITIVNGWVRVKDWPRGLSTFNRAGVPAGKDWVYFRIPEGTILPKGLAIVEDSFNETFQATHYTIAPAWDMPLATFKGLLNELARFAIKEAA
jgi:hypothetical protein